MQYDLLGETMRQKQTLCFREVYHFLEALFDDDLHAKRILSLANATLGVIKSCPCWKSNPSILMVQSAENWTRLNAPNGLNRPRYR